jgi:hypothetical protein
MEFIETKDAAKISLVVGLVPEPDIGAGVKLKTADLLGAAFGGRGLVAYGDDDPALRFP